MENLDTKQLKKRNKIFSIVLRVLISLHATCMTLVVFDSFGIADLGRFTLVPGLIFITAALPLIYSVRKLKAELDIREEN